MAKLVDRASKNTAFALRKVLGCKYNELNKDQVKETENHLRHSLCFADFFRCIQAY